MEKIGPAEAEMKVRTAFKLHQSESTGVVDGVIDENALVEINSTHWLNFMKEVFKYHIKSWLERVK